MVWLITLVSACAFGAAAYVLAASIKIKPGWQRGKGPIARWLDERRRVRFEEQLPGALSTMSNALRAGFSMSQAFDSVVEMGEAPLSEEFDILRRQLRIGMTFEDALESMNQRVGSDDLALVTTAMLISRRTGGNVTEIFDKISETILGRMKVERKVRTLTAQGRMQGAIVSAMPIFLGTAMTLLKPKMMLPFLASPIGIVSVLAMFVLIAVGWLIIRKIIKIDV